MRALHPAGSGKTNTLAHRVAHLIVNGADPRRILLMTFSRRAATEMTRRVERIARQVIGDRAGVMTEAPAWAGTFHGIGARLLPEIAGNRDTAGIGAPRDLADVDFAIVRASFAVAETGSVLLSETDLRANAVAYLAQHLIVLLDPADIVVNLHHAYRRPEFRDGHYRFRSDRPMR